MAPRGWDDQPKVIDDCNLVLRFFAYGRSWYLYRGPGETAYLSIGTLFGSQTVACADFDHALKALQTGLAAAADDKTPKLPKGCELI